MRRTLAVTAMVSMGMALAAIMLLPSAAGAKGGDEEHSTVLIRGPGLASPILLRHEEAATYMWRSGGGEPKWDVPNIGGTLTPHADLGPAYTAVVHLRCGGGVHSVYRQTLYPEAPQGLQVYTPPGAKGCFPGQFVAGYWPAARELLTLLVKRGLPLTSGDQSHTSDKASPAAAVVDRGTGRGSRGTGLAVVGSLSALALLAGGTAVALRRRRRLAKSGSA
jgi:hypothetical protein